jgi:hypothetical protein
MNRPTVAAPIVPTFLAFSTRPLRTPPFAPGAWAAPDLATCSEADLAAAFETARRDHGAVIVFRSVAGGGK